MKLTMLSGLPASGKSTRAKAMVKETGNSGRINRDDLRAMLFESVWTGKREQVVIDCEKAIAEVLFKHNMNAIIDDTNLFPKHRDMWSGFAKDHDAKFESCYIEESIALCDLRDSQRSRPVGTPVIHRMAIASGIVKLSPDREIVLVDIDGTLSDGTHREHHLKGEKKDWDSYYSLLSEDSPIDLVVHWVRELYGSYLIIIVSGRPDTYQKETISWLDKHEIPFDYILMRPGNDKRDDTIIKAEMLNILPKEQIVFAIDDRPKVIRMWKENGVKVFPVRGACEEF